MIICYVLKFIARTIFVLLISMPMVNRNIYGSDNDPEYQEAMLRHITSHIEVLSGEMIKGPLTSDEIWAEFEEDRKIALLNLKDAVERFKFKMKLDEELVKFDKGWQGTKRLYIFFIDQAKQPNAELRRFYEEGKNGLPGYTILVDGKPKYWLHAKRVTRLKLPN
jgi:hypothetical protein